MDTKRISAAAMVHTENELGIMRAKWLYDPVNLASLRDFINQQMAAQEAGYTVTIDYSKSLKSMIEVGQYDWHSADITAENFPIEGEGTVGVALELVHLNKMVSTEEVLAELDKRGFRPATLAELLALGWMFKELQREFPIVALGSVWCNRLGNSFVPYLSRYGYDRDLDLIWLDGGWFVYCRFLAVRK